MRVPKGALLIVVLLVDGLPFLSKTTTPINVQDRGGFVRTTSGHQNPNRPVLGDWTLETEVPCRRDWPFSRSGKTEYW